MQFLHTMIRVMDPEKSMKFYCDGLGMVLKRRADNENKRFTLYFLGVPGDETGVDLELTHNWDRKEPYELGNAYGHIALRVDSMEELGKHLQAQGIQWSWGPNEHQTMAFLEDPDGYEVEILAAGKHGQ